MQRFEWEEGCRSKWAPQPQLQLTPFQLVWEAAPAQLDSVFSLITIIVSSPYVTLSHQDKLCTHSLRRLKGNEEKN